MCSGLVVNSLLRQGHHQFVTKSEENIFLAHVIPWKE